MNYCIYLFNNLYFHRHESARHLGKITFNTKRVAIVLKAILILLFAMAAVKTSAKHLEPGQALERALSLRNGLNKVADSASAAKYNLKRTISSQEGISGCYIFSKEGSFIIVSADDETETILAYGDSEPTDWSNLPPSLEDWLKMYAEEIAHAPANTTSHSAPTKSRPKVNVLLSSKWNQYSPYNDKCPVFSGKEHCVTGCVATAMAQLMYKFKHPQKGTGSHSYTDDINGRSVSLSANFGATTYDWSNMTNTYKSSSSSSSKTAIATLMSHLGVATEMDYAYGGINESAASVSNAGNALINYFGYSKEIAYFEKEYYSTTGWEDILHGEISAGRAVLYSGGTAASCHAFICDGYDGAGKYHFNWGWGGAADGYFSLSALKPVSGTHKYDFTADQYMVLGIKPSAGEHYRANIKSRNGIKSSQSMGRRNEVFTIETDGRGDSEYAAFYNYTLGPKKSQLEIGANVVNKSTKASTFVHEEGSYTIQFNYGIWDFPLVTSSIEPGTYTVYPAARESSGKGRVFNMQLYNSLPHTFELEIGKTFVKLYNDNTSTYTLFASSFSIPNVITSGQTLTIKPVISSKYAAYDGEIGLQIYDATTLNLIDIITIASNVHISKNGKYTVNNSGIAIPYLSNGKYIISLADEDGIPFAETGEIKIEGTNPTIEVNSFNTSSAHIHSDEEFQISGTLSAKGGRYDGTLKCHLQAFDSQTVIAESLNEKSIHLYPSNDAYYSFNFNNVPEGTYSAIAYDKQSGKEMAVLGTVTIQNFSINISNIKITENPMEHRDLQINCDVATNESSSDYLMIRLVNATTGNIGYFDKYVYYRLDNIEEGQISPVTFKIYGRDFDITSGSYYIEFIIGKYYYDNVEQLPAVYRYGPLTIDSYVCDPVLIGKPYFEDCSPQNVLTTGEYHSLKVPIKKIADESCNVRATIFGADNDTPLYYFYLHSSSPNGTEEILEDNSYISDSGFYGAAYLQLEAYDYKYDYALLSPYNFNRIPLTITDGAGIIGINSESAEVRYDSNNHTIRISRIPRNQSITIFNTSGIVVYHCNASSEDFDIDFSFAPKGIYFIVTEGITYKIVK